MSATVFANIKKGTTKVETFYKLIKYSVSENGFEEISRQRIDALFTERITSPKNGKEYMILKGVSPAAEGEVYVISNL